MQPMTKTEVVNRLLELGLLYDMAMDSKLTVKTVDHTQNRIAPENYCYKVYYTDFTGKRVKFAFWPFTLGRQHLK